MTRIFTTALIHRSPEEVFAYVTAPGNWPQWHSSSLGVGGTLSSLEVGQECSETFSVAGRRGQVVWRCSERQAPKRWVIEGKIVGRNNGGTITYTLIPDGRNTRFVREFCYQMPNLFWSLLDYLIFRHRIEAESKEALRCLREVLEALPVSRQRSSA